MDIDLLFTQNGEAGLIANQNLIKKTAGVIFTMETGLLSLEFVDMDYMDLNITVDEEFKPFLDYCFSIHMGSFNKGKIAQAYQVPFMISDDPYRGQMDHPPELSEVPLTSFEHFIKSCVSGQPVHREDLGDEEGMGCVLGDAVPQSLQFAPHLARRRGFEAAPKLAPGHVPGLGLGSSGGGSNIQSTQGGQRGRPGDNKGKSSKE